MAQLREWAMVSHYGKVCGMESGSQGFCFFFFPSLEVWSRRSSPSLLSSSRPGRLSQCKQEPKPSGRMSPRHHTEEIVSVVTANQNIRGPEPSRQKHIINFSAWLIMSCCESAIIQIRAQRVFMFLLHADIRTTIFKLAELQTKDVKLCIYLSVFSLNQ